MNEEQLAEILKYSSSKELYIVSYTNVLKILFCPFKVRSISDIGTLPKDKLFWVQEVKVTKDLITVYIIKDKAYYYHHFIIIN